MKKQILIGAVALVSLATFFNLNHTQATPLRIDQTPNRAVVHWPTGAVTYVLERTTNLVASNWVTVANIPVITGSENSVTQEVAGVPRFYRLQAPSNSPPALAAVTGPTNLVFGSTGVLSLNFWDPDADVSLVHMILSNAVNVVTSTVAADWIRLTGVNGDFPLPLKTKDLVFGINRFTFLLIDNKGQVSATRTFTIELTGAATGGTAPWITGFQPTGFGAQVTKPTGPLDAAFANLQATFYDPEEDVARVRLKVTPPTGPPVVTETPISRYKPTSLSGSSFAMDLRPLKFSNTSPLGTYTFELTLFDTNANASDTVSNTVNLITSSFVAQVTPGVASFDPTNASWGDEIVVSGTVPEYELVTIELNDIPCEVLSQNFFSVVFKVPRGARTGPVIMRGVTSGGVGCSAGILHINPTLDIAPVNPQAVDENGNGVETGEALEISEGGQVQFEFLSSYSIGHGGKVHWLVNGISQGNTNIGTIDLSGLYTAPTAVNAPTNVTVSASLDAHPATTDSFAVRLVPKPIRPGGGLIRSIVGGTITAVDGRGQLTIPAGALASNTTISIRPLVNQELPAPPMGLRLLGGVEFQPDGIVFTTNATARVPLTHILPPGTSVTVLTWHAGTGSFSNELSGTVSSDGLFAEIPVAHFSTYVIATTPAFPGPAAAPVITLIEPALAEEGAKLPVRFTGTNFGDDLVVELLTFGGAATTNLAADGFVVNGTNLGFNLKISPLPALSAGVTNLYKLRLTRPGFGSADATFTVVGLNEYVLTNGQTAVLSNPPSAHYSSIIIPTGATLKVATGQLDWFCTGPIVVAGTIDAAGVDGVAGFHHQGGAAGGSTAGAAGNGLLDPDEYSSANYGKDAAIVDNSHPSNLRGYGGAPGSSVDLDPIGMIERLIAAISTLNAFELANIGESIIGTIQAVQDARAAYEQISSSVEEVSGAANQIADASAGEMLGRHGLGAMWLPDPPADQTSGGGGGGSGVFRIKVDLTSLLNAILPFDITSGVTLVAKGGGGGGGGIGGRSVHLSSAQFIQVDGTITTRGGDGGAGATTSHMEIFPEIFGFDLANVYEDADFPCAPGGGGGGGRGGRIQLLGNEGVLTDGTVELRKGRGGFGGFVEINPQDETMSMGIHRNYLGDGVTLGGEYNGPLYEPSELRTKTTDRRILRLIGRYAYHAFGGGASIANPDIYVQHLDTGTQTTQTIYYDTDLGRYDGAVLLAEGFNVVDGAINSKTTILVISRDDDGDGLSTGDEADLGTDPNNPDTDGDGLNDGLEVTLRLNPLKRDTDGDGLTDSYELYTSSTNPRKFDTDDDGFSDGAEVLLGSDAFADNSKPEYFPPNILLVALNGADTAGTRLAVIDLASQQMGILGRPANGFGFGMAFDAIGTLFTLNGGNLAMYDAFTDVSTPIGTLTNGILGGALAYRYTDGQLYTMELGPGPAFAPSGQLVRINPVNAVATRIGTPLTNAIRSLACTWDGKMFACLAAPSGGDQFVELDPATGTILSTNGATGQTPLFGLAISRDQKFYTSTPVGGTNGIIYEVNPTNGVTTNRFAADFAFFDLTVAPKPIPVFDPLWSFHQNHAVPRSVHAGNFNGDTNDDIVTMVDDYMLRRSVITLFTNDGAGNFSETSLGELTWLPDTFNYPFSLASGDLNGDGILDAVGANPNGAAPETKVFLSQTNSGGYSNHTSVSFTNSAFTYQVIIASMNPTVDSYPDIVVTSETNIFVMFNNTGDGQTFTTVSLPENPFDNGFPNVGDLNADGRLEIVGPGYIYPNNGDGTFGARQSFTNSGGYPTIADVNGDGHADVICGGSSPTNIFIALFVNFGNGTTTLPAETPIIGNRPNDAGNGVNLATDLDEDGVTDIIAGNFETGTYAFFRLGTPAQRIVLLRGGEFNGVTAPAALHNFQGDARPEIVLGNFYSHSINTYKFGHPFKE